MTLEQYVNNPMGKSNAVLSVAARENIRADYLKRYDQIMVTARRAAAMDIAG